MAMALDSMAELKIELNRLVFMTVVSISEVSAFDCLHSLSGNKSQKVTAFPKILRDNLFPKGTCKKPGRAKQFPAYQGPEAELPRFDVVGS
jgi:hypothetical protein